MDFYYTRMGGNTDYDWNEIKENPFETIPSKEDMESLKNIIIDISLFISTLSGDIPNGLEMETNPVELQQYLLDTLSLNKLNPLLDRLLAFSIKMAVFTEEEFDNESIVIELLLTYFAQIFNGLFQINVPKTVKKQEECLSAIDTTGLEIGMVIKNYKELCGLLDQEIKSGKSKRLQLSDFKRYFDYEKSGQKFIITDIYDSPLTKEDKRKLGNNSIYVKYIELILLQYLSEQKGYTKTFTKRNWWELLGMVNRKYNKISKHQLKKIDYRVTSFEIDHFYQRCNKKLEQILFSALNNLTNRKLIIWEPQTVIVSIDENRKEKYVLATDEDKKKILQVERHILKNVMGFEKIIQVYCRFKQNEYYQMVNNMLYDLYGWHHYFKQIKLIYTPEDVLEAIPQSKIDLQRELLNEKIITVLNENAQDNYNASKEKYGHLEESTYQYGLYSNVWCGLPDSYLDAQHILTDELINIGHEESRMTLDLDLEQYENDEDMNQLFTSFMC